MTATGMSPKASWIMLKFRAAPNEPALDPVTTTRVEVENVGTVRPMIRCMLR
jgi:hypothetical protein